jgi:hypothetical protein
MSVVNQQKNMLLISQAHMGEPTFGMISVSETCPYVECVYTPQSKQLAVITKTQKDTFHFFSRLDDNGDPIPAKRRVATRSQFKEERKQIKTFYEYYISEESEIIDFIKMFAVNADSFDFKKFFEVKAKAGKK